MNVRDFAKGFAGGEVTPEFWGRIDDAKYQMGLALCQNFIVAPHGPAYRRPGTLFVREVKDSTAKTRIISFAYSTTQTMVIELGNLYARFHTQGATLLAGSPPAYNNATAYVLGDLISSSGTNYYCIAPTTGHAPPNATYWYALPANGVYEIPTPFTTADLFDVHYVQSADVLSLVHPSYAPQELRRLGATKWTLTTPSFVSALTAPGSVVATATVATGTGFLIHDYVVTSASDDTIDESPQSASATCSNNLTVAGNYNTITWAAVAGVNRYNVYKKANGLYGYIGTALGTSFIDNFITPQIGIGPPNSINPFTGAGNYPGAVSYHEQRRVFGGTLTLPQSLWGTRSGTESNLTYSIPNRDDDAISFKIAARKVNTIRHLAPLQDLLILTNTAVWVMRSADGGAITATDVSIKPQANVGAANVQPLIYDNSLLYVTDRGGHVRDVTYDARGANAYVTSDLSLRAPHLFDGLSISDAASAEAPYPLSWFVSSSGKLLGLTYVPNNGIEAWHQHVTDGSFESVAVVAEGIEDAVYVIVNRTIGGSTKRYVERFAPHLFATQADAFFVDAGATYSGAPISTISSGLAHLEGKTVAIFADGSVRPSQVVTGGTVSLDQPASKIQVGLPYTSTLQTLPRAFQVPGFGLGRVKAVNKVWLRVTNSGGFKAGPTLARLTERRWRTTETFGSPTSFRSDEFDLAIEPAYSSGGQVYVVQDAPVPLTLVSLEAELDVAGG